ncbi:MAG: hypothetical protein ACI8RD_000470 [Bacillariaceae sp.]|jgi:hypothetical protein
MEIFRMHSWLYLCFLFVWLALEAVDAFNNQPCSSNSRSLIDDSYSKTRLLSEANDGDGDGVGLSRRQLGELSVAGLGLGISFIGTRENTPTDYGLWGVLPVGTYKSKKTLFSEVVADTIWTFDQKFGILNVQVPIRMVVVKLKGGGLFLYNPVAATPECMDMLENLIKKHGPLEHIVVGSVALEHKVYAGVLAQKFPRADVWLAPGQYSFPVNLPNPFLGFPSSRTKIVPQRTEDAPEDWKENFGM